MRQVLLNLTTSLDGFIADVDGGIDWILPPPANVPKEYLDLMKTIDAFVMGRATYESSLSLPGGMDLFEGKNVYVFTSRTDLEPHAGIDLIHEDPASFVARLKREPGGTIWLFGGGQLATALSSAGLVDDYLIAIQPILLGNGISLWQGGHPPQKLVLVHAREWPDGIVELRYGRPQE
ncbi:MAG: dihydrofolate reductase family protein [Actinomycetota bacterium]|jgi:dihydrofolate reductase|nr:dihydrofolate reductase family protein [Actinomycetota bacterium]